MKNPVEISDHLELQVNAWMSEISPGIKVKAIPYLDANMMGLRYGRLSVMGEESTNAVNMGFGVSYVLPVMISLLKARQVKINYFNAFEDQEGMTIHDITSPEILPDGSLSNWPEGFFDEWDKAIGLLI